MALGGVLLAGCASGSDASDDSLTATELGTPWQVPPIAMTDTGGATYSLTEDTGKPLTLVFFGYTNCPDICGMVMGNIASALARISDERDNVDVVFVTTDPARDDEAALTKYLERYDPEFIGLTAPMKKVLEAGKAFHVAIEKGEKLPSGGYDVTHGTQIFAVDGDDEIPMFWGQDTSPADLADDLSTLLEDES